MGKSAYIKFVEGSTTKQVSIHEVKQKLQHYIEMTTKTGEQLDWRYNQSAFPYTLQEKPESHGQWFYLKSTDPQLYHYIIVGVGSQMSEGIPRDQAANGETFTPADAAEQHYIQVTLTDQSTHGDKAKAIEFCKYLGKEYKAELHLFNGRIMYYNPRK